MNHKYTNICMKTKLFKESCLRKTNYIARRQKYLLDLFHSKLGSCKIHEWRKHLVRFFFAREYVESLLIYQAHKNLNDNEFIASVEPRIGL